MDVYAGRDERRRENLKGESLSFKGYHGFFEGPSPKSPIKGNSPTEKQKRPCNNVKRNQQSQECQFESQKAQCQSQKEKCPNENHASVIKSGMPNCVPVCDLSRYYQSHSV